MGSAVGVAVGSAVGVAVGSAVGVSVGPAVGASVGFSVGVTFSSSLVSCFSSLCWEEEVSTEVAGVSSVSLANVPQAGTSAIASSDRLSKNARNLRFIRSYLLSVYSASGQPMASSALVPLFLHCTVCA